MKRNRFKLIFMAAVLGTLGFSTIAHAQYVWVDEKGTRQYSDMPPPASVPQKRILKEPGSPSPTLSAISAEPAAGNPPPTPPVAKENMPLTTAEKNADFQRRKAEQAEKEKKAAQEAQRAADKAKHCDQARSYQRALQSGERLARTDKNGERYFLSDAQRATEAQEAKRILEACK